MSEGFPQAAWSDLVIVVPCFNESTRWSEDYWRELLALTTASLIFVNDGSTDKTPELIQNLSDHKRVQLVNLVRNSGKAEAVRQGLIQAIESTASLAATVGFLDADGAFSPNDIARMVRLSETTFADGYEALWSSRVALSGRQVSRSMSRHYVGRFIATILSASVSDLPYDSQSGFKLFRCSPELSRCLESPFRTRWLFDVELLDRWRKQTGRPLMLWEEPVLEWRDVPGSKIRGAELGRIAGEILTVSRISRKRSNQGPK